MTKRAILLGALACALIIGLCAPDALLALTDKRMAGKKWTSAIGESEFIYEGTLENRVRALEAWRSGSTGIVRAPTAAAQSAQTPNIWGELYAAGLLPIDNPDAEYTVTEFALAPLRVSAEYQYIEITCETDDMRLSAILDAHTLTYLSVDFTCDPALFTHWMQDEGQGFNAIHKADLLIDRYAQLLGLGALADLNYMSGDLIQGYESDVENTLFAASMRWSNKQGLVMYKLFAKSSS